MRLFLVRHGQTEWNLAQRFQGQSDIPLNPTGRAQAEILAQRLSDEAFDLVITSDLQRALETARLICGIGPQPTLHQDPRLREISFGDWEGLTYAEIQEKYPNLLAAWEGDVFHCAPPNGETLASLAQRAHSVLADLLETYAEKTILMVAHGGVLQVLICLALKLPAAMYWQFHLSPGSLSEIAFYPAGAILNLLNWTSQYPLQEDR